jgi:lipopolysaccharide/colanic/teichoic acid biosynthesis glycosyltransferase
MLRDRNTVLFLGDLTMLIASFLIMIALRFDWLTDRVMITTQTELFAWLFALWLLIFFIFDLYNLRRVNPNPRNVGLLALAVGASTLMSIIVLYIFPYSGTPKTNLAIVAISSFILLVIWRRLFYNLFTARFSQRIAVIGQGAAVDYLLQDLAAHPHIGKVVSVQPSFTTTADIPNITLAIGHKVDIKNLLVIAREKQCEVLSLYEAYNELFAKIPLALMSEEKATEVLSKRKQVSYRLLERLFEIIIASIILIVASPFLLIAAIAILIEDGKPVVIKQARVGKNSVVFLLYKLRTMKALAPDGSAEINGSQWATVKDPRITKVGAFLRKSHLDEVLQMLNIIRGDIALIGPRPERPEFVSTLEQTIPYYFLRHTIKPGFTGWAQIKFRYARSELDAQEKFEYDLYYLLNKNPLFDLGILVKTVQIFFTH